MESHVKFSMGNSGSFQLCFLFFLACGRLAIPTVESIVIDGQGLPPKPEVALFVFGDSIYDPGNNNYINTTMYKANVLPYGETYFEFATGRFCDGLIIPDFIAKYAKLPLIPPYFMSSYLQFPYGVNFASAGAGALVETSPGQAINLRTQLIYFKDVVKQLRRRSCNEETKELLSNAVYMFSIGGNDITVPNPIFSRLSTQEYVQIVIGNFSAVIQDVYNIGGRKFGFITSFPVQCLPYVRVRIVGSSDGEVCVKGKIPEVVKQFNAALSKELERLRRQLRGFRYSKFDLFTAALQRIQNPSNYGFEEVRSACCGSGIDRANFSCGGKRGESEYELCKNPREYFFFDSLHPTQKAYSQLAELMWDGPPSFVAPYALKSFFQTHT